MKEIITVNIGQPGVQIGNQILSLYAAEHGLTKGGEQSEKRETGCIDEKYNEVLFSESRKGRWAYRSIAVDFDQMTIDELKRGSNRQLYSTNNLLSTKQETGGNYARGAKISERQLTQLFQDKLRLMIENCDNFQGIFFNHSLLGGTAGFFTNMQSKIIGENMIEKKPVISSMLFPSENMGNGVMETYNYTMGFKGLLQFNNLTIVYDNQTLYKMCEGQLGIESPSYPEVNSLIAQMNSSVTLSARSAGPLNANLNELLTNMVCYPRIQLVYPSLTQISGFDGHRSKFSSVLDITRNIFKPESKMLKVYDTQNKISVSLLYRGPISPYQVRESLKRIRNENDLNSRFQEWSPLGFKVGINQQSNFGFSQQQNRFKPLARQKTCCSLTNSMEFNGILGHFNHKFDLLYARRAFVHWLVGEGLDEYQLVQCREDMAALEKDYESSCCQCFQQQEESQEC